MNQFKEWYQCHVCTISISHHNWGLKKSREQKTINFALGFSFPKILSAHFFLLNKVKSPIEKS